MISNEDGESGSLTMIGTVSPAGGNFEEPVTQSTLATVKCFLGLSYDRAYKRFFPAVDPLISWSRYLDQMKPWYDANLSSDWVAMVTEMQKLLVRGESINQMMQVTGEEGVTLGDYVEFQKSPVPGHGLPAAGRFRPYRRRLLPGTSEVQLPPDR